MIGLLEFVSQQAFSYIIEQIGLVQEMEIKYVEWAVIHPRRF